MLGSVRVFQNTSLPVKDDMFRPLSRAASTLARCVADQYSSCPAVKNILWLVSSAPPADVPTSMPLVYETSYPFASRNRIIGDSAYITQLRPWSSSAVWKGRL